ncbi:HAD domain-containing protein [Streptomyces sp. NPDC006476]|uniref:HAD domain-containing protein n=1 Tax=Streptomyces sp. NPDC006476 TaxID=3157175 RepID=UPI00339FF486
MPVSTLLFLDVDGTLIPFGAADPYPSYTSRHTRPETADAHPLLSRVDPALGARLTALGCELVWATTWLTDANTCLAPWLGLPQLPLVDWPDQDDTTAPLHWKTRPLVAWAAGRPFVWVDDELTDADRAWVAARHPAPALLHRVDHRYGLTDEDFAVLQAWLGRSRGALRG